MKKLFNSIFFAIIFLNMNISYGGSLAENNIKNKLDEMMQISCYKQHFSGVILIAMDGTIIFKKACGLANRSFNIKNNLDVRFNLGSVGKLFTSIAITQLIQQNKIQLSTPVYQILPDWLPNNKQSKRITIEQLLVHSSGLGNFMDDKRWKLGADSGLYVKINDYKPLIHDDKLLFTPGTSQRYSNNGYILLGAIIEAITHMSYLEYLEKNVFEAAGMKSTGIWSLDEIISNRSEGYFQICDQGKCIWKNNNFEAPFIGSPAGGAYTTAEDMFRFSESLHHSKLLSPELTQKILSGNAVSVSSDIKTKLYKIDDLVITGDFSPYGFAGAWNSYGFAVWENPLLLGHTGGIQGASAFFATSFDNKYTVVILSNISGAGPIKLYTKIREILGFSGKVTNY